MLLLVALVCAAVGLGILPGDLRKIDAFATGVSRWQKDPDFRLVEREYVSGGVAAMQARWCGVSARSIVMGFRSLPGLPDSLAVKDSSAAHYRAFAEGELSAYLHLSGEQGVPAGIEMIELLGKLPTISDDDIVRFLGSFKLPVPVATDAGAIASVRRLIDDVQPATPLVARGDIVASLRRQASELAKSMNIPPDPDAMTRNQQHLVLQRLDDYVRETNRELWRTKQVADFLSGIWAQGYGQIYLDGIEWLWRIQRIARIAFAITLVILSTALVRAYRPRMDSKEPPLTQIAADDFDPRRGIGE